MKYSVFISHSSKDSALAKELCRLLEVNSVPCWIAPRNVLAGSSYGEEIAKAIEDSSVVVLLLTKSANDSRAVANELELAFRYQKTIVPIRVASVHPSKSIEFFVSNAQWVDAKTSPLKKRVPELVRIVKAIEHGENIPRLNPEENSWFSKLERLLEQTFIHKYLAVSMLFLLVFISLTGIYTKVSFTENIIEHQQKLVQQDPSTFGLINLHPTSYYANGIGLQATVYLNLKNAEKLGVAYKSLAESDQGHFVVIDLDMKNKTPVYGDPIRFEVLAPKKTVRINFCIQATHPELQSPYEASWSFRLDKVENEIQIQRLGEATLLPLIHSNCDPTKINQSKS